MILETLYLSSSSQTSTKLWRKCLWKPFPSTQRTKRWRGTVSFYQCKSPLPTWLLSL